MIGHNGWSDDTGQGFEHCWKLKGASVSSFGNTTYFHAFSHYFGGFICFIIMNIKYIILMDDINGQYHNRIFCQGRAPHAMYINLFAL